jgi:GWxTD domain-containing protein
MKRFAYLLSFITFAAQAQGLREMNFKHWYDPEFLSVQIRPVRDAGQWRCQYIVEAVDSTRAPGTPEITWEIRKSMSDKEPESVAAGNIANENGSPFRGTVTVPLSEEVRYLVARVSIPGTTRSYYYYTILEPNYPERNSLLSRGEPVVNRYLQAGQPVTVQGENRFFVSHYDDNFPTAPLAFSEALGKVSKQMKVDSTFTIDGGGSFVPSSIGLYLIQSDTLAAEGIAFRAEADYPRYAKLKNLAAPLVYICTSQEYERIKLANGEKKAFDRVILSITKDTDRAKTLMRSYFKRVGIANSFFTSYKEGWKTDRGMIFIIFGPPDEVYRSADREVWNYRQEQYKVTFNFARSPSLFDPNNYVLIRDNKYKELWYEVIDLWRNARF